jgi:glutaredoxin
MSGRIDESATVYSRADVYNPPMHDVVVYSRKGCHLCEIVKETLAQIQGQADFQWREVDIDADPELRQKYNEEVPVVFIDGRKAFKYHMDAHRLLRALAGRA